MPRGEVGLIFASIGLANGVLDAEAYGALLLVLLLTTIVTPPLLRLPGHEAGGRLAGVLVTDVSDLVGPAR